METGILLYVAFFVLLALVVFRRLRAAQVQGNVADLSKSVRRTEAKVDLLLKHAGLTYDPRANVPPGVLDALRAGQKIEAIRQYRMATGVDLKTAKEFVDGL
jgi:ribosomal protein L7/L12